MSGACLYSECWEQGRRRHTECRSNHRLSIPALSKRQGYTSIAVCFTCPPQHIRKRRRRLPRQRSMSCLAVKPASDPRSRHEAATRRCGTSSWGPTTRSLLFCASGRLSCRAALLNKIPCDSAGSQASERGWPRGHAWFRYFCPRPFSAEAAPPPRAWCPNETRFLAGSCAVSRRSRGDASRVCLNTSRRFTIPGGGTRT